MGHIGCWVFGVGCWLLNSASFWRAAAVVRNRRAIRNRHHFEAGSLQRADRGFASGAGALDLNVHALKAMLLGFARSALRRNLGGERRALAAAFEVDRARARPAEHVALSIGDRDERIV